MATTAAPKLVASLLDDAKIASEALQDTHPTLEALERSAVEIPSAVLIEACAAILHASHMIRQFAATDAPASEACDAAYYDLLVAAAGFDPNGPREALYAAEDVIQKHPVMVEAYARGEELIGDAAGDDVEGEETAEQTRRYEAAARIRRYGDARAKYEDAIEEFNLEPLVGNAARGPEGGMDDA